MSKKITEEIFDDNGNLVDTKEVEVASEPNWSEYNLGFFQNSAFNQVRVIAKQNPESELAAIRMELLANKETERFDIYAVCWNQMIGNLMQPGKDLISEEVVDSWNNICQQAEMPFIYNEQGLLELV